jgi:hypothetical protein
MRWREPYQGTVFLTWMTWIGLVGLRAGCEAGTVFVGMLPWALIAAMLSSHFGHACAHWLLSRSKADTTTLVFNERGLRFIDSVDIQGKVS